jgi:hypothetical protein
MQRFWDKVDDDANSCWLWTAAIGHNGYGRFWFDGRHVRAHRFAYELLVGPIPEGMELDHLCRVRHCVNPAHLEIVEHRENMLRGDTIVALNSRKQACPRGHPFSPENTRVYRGRRHCRACARIHTRRWREKGGVI